MPHRPTPSRPMWHSLFWGPARHRARARHFPAAGFARFPRSEARIAVAQTSRPTLLHGPRFGSVQHISEIFRTPHTRWTKAPARVTITVVAEVTSHAKTRQNAHQVR